MNWLKDVIIDLAITLVIVAYALWRPEWAWWVVVLYTPLMVVLKLAALGSGVQMLASKQRSEVPPWVYHALYAANVVALAVAGWWLMAAGWAAIWVLSVVAERRATPRPRTA